MIIDLNRTPTQRHQDYMGFPGFIETESYTAVTETVKVVDESLSIASVILKYTGPLKLIAESVSLVESILRPFGLNLFKPQFKFTTGTTFLKWIR